MNNFGYDDVNGEVIGEVMSVSGQLFYHGRPQCQKQFFKCEQDAIKAITLKQREIIKENAIVVDYVFPDNEEWHIVINDI